ncbi:MAG: heat-inducible transcription repressor HrcA [Oscillospiraceae bacterium]|nr:heat-inducible transcription repressor HrcA [Oscillospiraceae bacterium]
MDISNRKQLILAQIVALHTNSGDPVGSHLLQEFLDTVSVSTATLRNEMAQLTALGLLEQPHTSAGRVPTVEGYRYFLNNLMTAKPLSAAEKRAIESAVNSMDPDPDRAAQSAAEHLAKLSGLGAVTTTPVCADTKVIHFELVRVGRYNTAVLGITNLGALKSSVCRTMCEFSAAQLTAVAQVINNALRFVSHADVSAGLLGSMAAALGDAGEAAMPILLAAANLLREAGDVQVCRAGQGNLLRYRELSDHVSELVRLFEDTEGLSALLSRDGEIDCYVGEELGRGYGALSLIVGRYRTPGGGHGGIGIVGPVRMDYANLIPRLRYFCSCMSEALAAR